MFIFKYVLQILHLYFIFRVSDTVIFSLCRSFTHSQIFLSKPNYRESSLVEYESWNDLRVVFFSSKVCFKQSWYIQLKSSRFEFKLYFKDKFKRKSTLSFYFKWYFKFFGYSLNINHITFKIKFKIMSD